MMDERVIAELARRISALERLADRQPGVEEAGGGGGGAPTNAQYLVKAADGTLTHERVWSDGANIESTDGGAGGAFTVAVSPQGAGSGLDADTVDAVQLADLVQKSEIGLGLSVSGGAVNLDINELTAAGAVDGADYVAIYDASEAGVRKQTRNDFLSGTTAASASETAQGVIELATQAEVDAGTDDQRAVTALKLAQAATVQSKIGKNLLYSSLCHNLWQEGTTLNDLADDTYGPDSVWCVLNKSNAPDISGQAGASTDPFTTYFRCTFDASTEQAGIVQFLEAEDTIPLRGQVVSLSADLWGTNVATLRMAVIVWTGTADALTSDVVGTWAAGNPTLAANWAYIDTPAAINISGSRTRYNVPNLTIPTNANNIGVFIWTDAEESSGDLWNVARVQLERGPVATEFVARPVESEYALVARYLLKSYALATAPGTVTDVNRESYQTRTALAGSTAGTLLIETVLFPVRMRTAPAITLYSTGTGATGAVRVVDAAADRTGASAQNIGDSRFGNINATNASATAVVADYTIAFHYKADARL